MQFILTGLAVMWAIGLLMAVGGFVFYMLEEVWHKVIGGLLLVPVWALTGLSPLGILAHETGPELATLLKSEWVCDSEHSETTYVMSGKVMVPRTSQVCDVYKRRK